MLRAMESLPAGLRKALPYIAVALTIIGFVNFFWFLTESMSLGGDAINGYQRDGHYFLGNKGSYTEVTKSVWEWSRIHAESVWITHPLALLGIAYFVFSYRSRLSGVGGRSTGPDQLVDSRATSPRPPAGIETILRAQGVAVGLVLIVIGILWSIPQNGAFGVAWTALAIVITAINVRRWMTANRK